MCRYFCPEGDISKQADGEYNADEIDSVELATTEIEGQDMPKKSTRKHSKKSTKIAKKVVKKSTKITMTSTNWSKHLGKPIPVELSNILPDDTFRCRKQEHEPTVNKYARNFKDYIDNRNDDKQKEKLDYPFPPIVIWRDESMEDGKYLLVTGFHRYHAAEKEEFSPILAQEFSGTEKEALLFALENNRHGREMSSSDLKYAIGKAYKEFPGISLQMVAQKLGCNRTYVHRIKKQLLTSKQLTETETVIGVDGRERKTTRKVNDTPKTDDGTVPDQSDHAEVQAIPKPKPKPKPQEHQEEQHEALVGHQGDSTEALLPTTDDTPSLDIADAPPPEQEIDTHTLNEIANADDAINEILTKIQNAVNAFMKLPQWSDQAAFVDDMLKILRESLTDGVEEIDVLIEKLGISTDKPEL